MLQRVTICSSQPSFAKYYASTPRRRQETLETLKKSSGIVNKSSVAADVGPWTETQQWIRRVDLGQGQGSLWEPVLRAKTKSKQTRLEIASWRSSGSAWMT
ncbi:putative L-asparaginase 3 [Fusarium oxysporum f. sp. albedinis]|nr:putative L-asparaginase 3 [Fusarium oxysporum f. sp. albedinis]